MVHTLHKICQRLKCPTPSVMLAVVSLTASVALLRSWPVFINDHCFFFAAFGLCRHSLWRVCVNEFSQGSSYNLGV